MAESQVPEWSTEYLPYRDMKKMLKELVVTVGAEERAAANERAARGEDRADAEPVPGLASPFKVRTRASGRATLTDERGSRKRGELITVRRLHTGSSTDESVPLRGGAVDDASDVAPLRVSRGDPNKVGNPADNVISTSILEPSSAGGDRVLALEHERRFFFALDDHLRRVVAFYGDRLSRARREAMNERVQLRHLRREAVRALDDLRAGEARELRRETALDRFLSSGDTSARVSTSDDSLAALRDRVAKTARSARLLRRAVSESYRGMNMLESYVSLNMEAFRKIVKKHDKLTGWQTQETYMKGLKELRVFHDDEVGELRAGMESAYLKIEEVLCALEPDRWKQRLASGGGAASSAAAPGFYEVRKRRNQVLSKLREDGRMEPRTTLPRLGTAGPAFASGLALGAAIALGAMFTTRVVEACATPTSTASPHARPVPSPNAAIGPSVAHPSVTAWRSGDRSANASASHAPEMGPAPKRSGKCSAPPAAYRTVMTLRKRARASSASAGTSGGSDAARVVSDAARPRRRAGGPADARGGETPAVGRAEVPRKEDPREVAPRALDSRRGRGVETRARANMATASETSREGRRRRPRGAPGRVPLGPAERRRPRASVSPAVDDR